MIIVINGSVGVGKSTISWGLLERFEKAVMLDGDYIGAVHPFEIYDQERIEYLYKTITHLVKFHMSNGYNDFVLNYVFENHKELARLTAMLEEAGQEVRSFLLTCSDEEQRKRILKRSNGRITDQVEWELNRFLELNKILAKAQADGFIGREINTTGKDIQEIIDKIKSLCKIS
ncbi:MAG: AAA family ATPase [bacterium]